MRFTGNLILSPKTALREIEKIRIHIISAFFSKWFQSICGMPYFELETPYFVRFDPCLVLNTDSLCYFRKKYEFSVFNTKYGSTRTKYGVFQLKIRKSVQKKTLDPYFLHFAQCCGINADEVQFKLILDYQGNNSVIISSPVNLFICISKKCHRLPSNVQSVKTIHARLVYANWLFPQYSETCLKRTPWGPIFLSALDRCPPQTGYVYETLTSKFTFGSKIFCPLQEGVRLRACPLQTGFTVIL